MDFAETKAGAAREIALAFGAPPLLLGLPGDNTFSNYQEANRAFWRQTVLPLVVRLQKSFQVWLQPGFGAFRFDYNADRLEALAQERAMEWERIGKAPFLTVDEQREAVGYAPMPKDATALLGKRGAVFERRYSPDQPRVPAGNSDGGQWTSGGGGGSAGRSSSEDVALNVDRDLGRAIDSTIERVQEKIFDVDLTEDEGGAHDGHAIRDHVGKSDEYLKNRVRSSISGNRYFGKADTRAGSFTSLAAANKLVNSTLAQNRSIVESLVNSDFEVAALIKAYFGSPTGREAYTLRPWDASASIMFRDVYGVSVVIKRTRESKKGYWIITAFPSF